MASLRGEIDGQPMISATTPHFLKIILEDTLRDSKLKIPKMFVRKYGKHLSNPVYLKLPSGSEWQVELKKSDNEAWLDKGWPEFSEFYSLDCGDLLVFGYKGGSKFKVCIFNRSTTEIDYPITSNHCDQPADSNGEPTMPQMEATKDDVSVEILEDFLPSSKTSKKSSLCDDSVEILEDFHPPPKKREKSPLANPCPQPHKKNRTSSCRRAESSINLQNVIPHNGPRNSQSCEMMFEKSMNNKYSHWPRTEMKGIDDFPERKDAGGSSSTQRFVKRRCNQVLGRMISLDTSEKAIALKRANAFQSENPYFKVAMQPSYIQQSFLNLPLDFAKRHLIEKPAGNAILGVSNGTTTWSVKFKYKKSRALFLSGWVAFARDNNLKVGDVCVFMLIDKIKPSFKVVFSRTTEAASWPFSPDNKVGSDCTINCEIGTTTNQVNPNEFGGEVKAEMGKYKMYSKLGGQVTQRASSLRVLEAANKFIPTNPFFKVFLGSAWKGSKVHVPVSFSKSYIKEKKQTATLQVGDRLWPVNLITYSHKQSFRFCGGWPAFAKENCLREGDVCIFELIELNDIILKVHIFSDHE